MINYYRQSVMALSVCPYVSFEFRPILSADAYNVQIQLSIVNVSRMRAFRSSIPSLFASNVPCSNPCFISGHVRSVTGQRDFEIEKQIDVEMVCRFENNEWCYATKSRNVERKNCKFLCLIKSRTHGDTVMVHGVVWWFSGADNRNFDNACYVTHESW